jgi:hypothetical protein
MNEGCDYEITCIQGTISDKNLVFILELINDYVEVLNAVGNN